MFGNVWFEPDLTIFCNAANVVNAIAVSRSSNTEVYSNMATIDQLTPIANTTLNEAELQRLETGVGYDLPQDFRTFLAEVGYASFIDTGYGVILIGDKVGAFGQFYGKRPGMHFDPSGIRTGALRIGEELSHYPSGSIVFAGDELGGEYFIRVIAEQVSIYWMIYSEEADYIKVCDSFSEFLERLTVTPYDNC